MGVVSNSLTDITLGPDTASIVHILKQFKVNRNFILRKCPGFFNMKGEDTPTLYNDHTHLTVLMLNLSTYSAILFVGGCG